MQRKQRKTKVTREKSGAFRIFLCSTYSDLVDEREAVLDVIRRLQHVHDSMEFFGARPDCPLDTCLAEVRASDIVLVIVGHRYGTLVPGHKKSYIDLEYEEAWRTEKPCLVYFRSDDVPILPSSMEKNPSGIGALDALKKRLLERHTVAAFRHLSDLAGAVAADLSRTVSFIEQQAAEPTAEIGRALELMDFLRTPFMVCTSDNRIQSANESMATALGYTVSELIGKEIGSFCDRDSSYPGDGALWELASRNERLTRLGMRRKDGSLVFLEFVLDTHDFIDGPRIQCVVHDVTERTRVEEVLRESESRFRHILERAPAAILVLDGQMRCVFANQKTAYSMGLSMDAFFGKSLEELPICLSSGKSLQRLVEDTAPSCDQREHVFFTAADGQKHSFLLMVRRDHVAWNPESPIYILLAVADKEDH